MRDTEQRFLDAMNAKQAGDFGTAIRVLMDLEKESSDPMERAAFQLNLAGCYSASGEFECARQSIQAAKSLASDSPELEITAELVTAQLARLERRPTYALVLIEQLLERVKSSPEGEYRSVYEDARLELAYCLVDLGQFNQALPILADAEGFDLTPVDCRKLHLNKGVSLSRLDKPELAVSELNRALDPSDDEIALFAEYELARICLKQGLFGEALMGLQKCEAKLNLSGEDLKDLYNLIAEANEGLGNLALARQYRAGNKQSLTN